MNGWVQIFEPSAVAQLSKCRKTMLFSREEAFWWRWRIEVVAGAVGLVISNSYSTDSSSPRTQQMLQIFQNLQCWTDTAIRTMICTRFIFLLTGNRSNHNPFLACNRPFQPPTFPATASHVCERDSSAPKVGYTRRKVGNCYMLPGDQK